MPNYPSLDPHTLNQKIEHVKSAIESEIDELEARFEDLYNTLHKMKADMKPKVVKSSKKKKKETVDGKKG